MLQFGVRENSESIIADSHEKLNTALDEINAKREAALRLLADEASNTVKKIIKHSESTDEKISLDASKYLAKLAGLEFEQHKIDGKGFVLQISSSHADKIKDSVK